MKRLIILFLVIFSFSGPIFADEQTKYNNLLRTHFINVRENVIEGMRIGGNLLRYFNKKEQAGMLKYYDEDQELTTIIIESSGFDTFDLVQVTYFEEYNEQTIKSIAGIKNYYEHAYPNGYLLCKHKIKDIAESLFYKKIDLNPNRLLRGSPQIVLKDDTIHPLDKSGKSKFSTINFYLESADFSGNINLTCYDWSIEFERKTGWIDSLTVSIDPWNSLKVIKLQGEPFPLLFAPEDIKYISTEKYYALVIGNNNYQHLQKLEAAENDAKVLANILENKYGFEVKLLLNADYDTTVNLMYAISRKLTKDDNLLIFYAGHGELDKKENRGYWLPIDASYELRSKWISNSFIADQVKATDAKHVLVIVDSCFAGSLMRSATKKISNQKLDEEYIKSLQKKKTRLIITSGGNEPVMDSDGGEHSIFAKKLIETLEENKNVINTQSIFESIRKYVASNAEQTPERAELYKVGHDGGDFLFFAKN